MKCLQKERNWLSKQVCLEISRSDEPGLESMRVRLGQGFVSQSNLDKKIQRMVATYGTWARKMLQVHRRSSLTKL